jgi:hypothetical protein
MTQQFSRLGGGLLTPALALLCGGAALFAQDRMTCSSDGGRTVCNADTRNGVRMVRQLTGARCWEGYSWGYTDRGIWVDRGCSAEFETGAYPGRMGEYRTQLDPGTVIPVRVDESIDSTRSDNRIYTGVVDHDVRGVDDRLAIPRGSTVEMIVRVARDGDLILDLESVIVWGQRYGIQAEPDRIEAGRRADRRTGAAAGGGAAIGAIIGAIAGGGKGAAIGAGAGAAVGAAGELATHGRRVHIPSESIVTFRLDNPLTMGVADPGSTREGYHYHPDHQ